MKSPSVKISEKQRQNQVIVTLRSLGYVVLLLGQKRQIVFCKKCGEKNWPITTANTPGAADLLVSHERWPGCWLALEMKTPTTTRRSEQIHLAELGMNTIIETVQEALDAVCHLERQWDIAPLPAMATYRKQV